jgi:hypothetical protein
MLPIVGKDVDLLKRKIQLRRKSFAECCARAMSE